MLSVVLDLVKKKLFHVQPQPNTQSFFLENCIYQKLSILADEHYKDVINVTSRRWLLIVAYKFWIFHKEFSKTKTYFALLVNSFKQKINAHMTQYNTHPLNVYCSFRQIEYFSIFHRNNTCNPIPCLLQKGVVFVDEVSMQVFDLHRVTCLTTFLVLINLKCHLMMGIKNKSLINFNI